MHEATVAPPLSSDGACITEERLNPPPSFPGRHLRRQSAAAPYKTINPLGPLYTPLRGIQSATQALLSPIAPLERVPYHLDQQSFVVFTIINEFYNYGRNAINIAKC